MKKKTWTNNNSFFSDLQALSISPTGEERQGGSETFTNLLDCTTIKAETELSPQKKIHDEITEYCKENIHENSWH